MVFSVRGATQAPSSAHDSLAAGIAQARAGDYYRALLTLNDVVSPDSRADAVTLARAYAYRALAFIGLDQAERATASVLLALKANPGIAVVPGEFGPNVAALFDDARRPATADPEARGRAAEQAGRFQDAFLAYLSAFQALPEPPAAADDQRLRERIINAAQKQTARPAIPPEALAHFTRGNDLMAADAALGASGGAATQQRAAVEWRQAVRLAPWWPEPIVKLAQAQQKLQRLDEALANLNLYRLADPEGYLALTRPPVAATAATAPVAAPSAAVVGPAVLYIYYLPTMRSMGMKPKTECDGQHVADLENGHYVKLSVAPGNHLIKVNRSNEISMNLEANRTHYLRYGVEGYPAHFAVHVKTAAEGAAEIAKRGIVANEPTRTFSADCGPASAQGRPRD